MHLCRDLFPTLLETEGKLLDILTSTFSSNCSDLYEAIIDDGLEDEFKNFIYGKVDMENFDKIIMEKKTPYELLVEVGYDLIECTSEEEIQSYKRYYAPDEELCTFNGGRLERCVVFWAVRKDVDEIKREDYTKPSREDRYGTSVMGIQFNKRGKCTVSIKNRYNHRVNNPDATYGNDLDRIIPGLAQSFKELLQERGLTFETTNKEDFEIPGYVVAGDGKYYRYNIEADGIYYCPGNIVIKNGEVHHLQNHQMLIDYYVVDFEHKTIQMFDNDVRDSFVDEFYFVKKIEVVKGEDGERTLVVYDKRNPSPILIEIDKNYEITGYVNRNVEVIGDNFLKQNQKLEHLELPRLQTAEDDCLLYNEWLEQLELPSLKKVGNNFLRMNYRLCEVDLPQLEVVGNGCFMNNERLECLELPQLRHVGDDFLRACYRIYQLKLPELVTAGHNFLLNNGREITLELPKLENVGDDFLLHNYIIRELRLLSLVTAGNQFLGRNKKIEFLELPHLQRVGDKFLQYNVELKQLSLPQLRFCGYRFLQDNNKLNEVELPLLEECGSSFLYANRTLRCLKLPQIQSVGYCFLYNNEQLSELIMPNLKEVGDDFMYFNKGLKELELPCLEVVRENFMPSNMDLMKLELPELRSVGAFFLQANRGLEYLKLPKLERLGHGFFSINNRLKALKLPKLNEEQYRIELNQYHYNLLKKSQEVVDSQSIATLDKESGLTKAEIDFVAGKLEKGNGIEKKENKDKVR